jgi:hypothetical protein
VLETVNMPVYGETSPPFPSGSAGSSSKQESTTNGIKKAMIISLFMAAVPFVDL